MDGFSDLVNRLVPAESEAIERAAEQSLLTGTMGVLVIRDHVTQRLLSAAA